MLLRALAAHGASVTGVVRVEGAGPPPRPPTAVTVDPAVCGASVPDESLVVGASGGVRDAVVVLRGVTATAPPPADEIVVDNRGCRFVPRVQIVRRGQTVRVRNSDPVLHNAHPVVVANPEVSIANLALAREGLTMDLTRRLIAALPATGEAVVRLRCDVHPWMAGWLVVEDHPWAAVTDADGRFTLRDVPPGAYTLAVWHERLGRKEQSLTIAPDGAPEVTIAVPSPKP